MPKRVLRPGNPRRSFACCQSLVFTFIRASGTEPSIQLRRKTFVPTNTDFRQGKQSTGVFWATTVCNLGRAAVVSFWASQLPRVCLSAGAIDRFWVLNLCLGAKLLGTIAYDSDLGSQAPTKLSFSDT